MSSNPLGLGVPALLNLSYDDQPSPRRRRTRRPQTRRTVRVATPRHVG